MRRVYRQPSDEARQRMSAAQKGKTKPESVKQKISQAMKEYWRTVPSRPETTMASYLGKSDADNNNKSVHSGTPK